MQSSTGLRPRTAAALAYSGWWITGAILWFVERRDRHIRFHAAQAICAFGLIALLVLMFAALAAASLSFLPSTYEALVVATVVTWGAGVLLWGVTMWKVATGGDWRIPFAADLADRLSRV